MGGIGRVCERETAWGTFVWDRLFFFLGLCLLVIRDSRDDGRDTEWDLSLVPERSDVEVHEHEFAVRRLEDEHPLLLKLVELHTLVEVDIVELDRTVPAAPAASVDEQVVVESKVELGGTGEV